MEQNQVNRTEVVNEVRILFERYETALLQNDQAVLNAFFWNDAQVLRYGIAEHSFGIDEIRTYRQTALPVNPGRKLRDTVITTFGNDAASVCTEFISPDSPLIGRQTQMWIRFDQGWKIVAAHISKISPSEPSLC